MVSGQEARHACIKSLISEQCVTQVLPKAGQLIAQVQTAPPAAVQPERSNQEVSSGAGELSDSMSVAEVGVSHLRKKKSRVRSVGLSHYLLRVYLDCSIMIN